MGFAGPSVFCLPTLVYDQSHVGWLMVLHLALLHPFIILEPFILSHLLFPFPLTTNTHQSLSFSCSQLSIPPSILGPPITPKIYPT